MDFENDDTTEFFDKIINMEDFDEKIAATEEVNHNPLRMVIAPYPSLFTFIDKEEAMAKLNKFYDYYLKLDQDNKNFSDQKSFEIWGYRVMDMYNMIKADIETIQAKRKESLLDITSEGSTDYLDLCKSGVITESIDWKLSETGIKEKIQSNIESNIELNYENCIRESDCPYYTIDEMKDLKEEYGFDYPVIKKDVSYLNLVRTYQEAFSKDPTDENMIKCLSIGWNPYVSYNNTKFAKQRQMHYYKEHGFRVIDLTKFEDDVVTESTSNLTKEFVDKDIYPVYIVLSYTDDESPYYTHAGLSLDSDMKNIYTFVNDEDKSGFQVEELSYYRSLNRQSKVIILTLFVNKSTLNLIKSKMDQYVDNQNDKELNNLTNVLSRTKKGEDSNSISLICTQFVDIILKSADLDVTKTDSNLVDPETFIEISENPKVYQVYSGNISDYKESRVENAIKKLFNNEIRSRLLYKDSLNLMEEGYYGKLLDDMLTPTYSIQERVFPLGIRDDGKFNIKIYKSIQDKYQESHDILLTIDQNRGRRSYETKELDSIKYELAKLFYLNSVLTKKIYKMKVNDKDHKTLVDLRARVLNDFKKYLPKVIEADKGFNFGKYYSDSEFDRGNLVVDNKLAEFVGKKIIDSIKKDKKKDSK
jgi:hypothetical protein